MSTFVPDSPPPRQQVRVRRAKAPVWMRLVLWLAGVLLLLALFIFLYIRSLMGPVSVAPAPEVIVEIPAKALANQIASELFDRGLVRSQWLFLAYTRYTGQDKRLKSGEYTLSPSDTLAQLVDKLERGQVLTYSFTIPEGLTLEQTAAVLAGKGIVNQESFMRAVAAKDFNFPFLEGVPLSDHRLEGFLFPDTYRIPKGQTAEQIVEMMLSQFNRVYNETFRQRAAEMGMTPLQVVTLASIIERETKKAEEREVVSAVFHNRLKKKWKLESCATIQFILGEPKEVLTFADLALESPYNTYKYTGLPPGPIAAPGAASIKAALYPANVDYMFFVVKPDGSHAFARTLQEHNANKRKYLTTR